MYSQLQLHGVSKIEVGPVRAFRKAAGDSQDFDARDIIIRRTDGTRVTVSVIGAPSALDEVAIAAPEAAHAH